MRRPPLTAARCGFTLVEVILAVAILGIGLTVLVASASRCLAVIHSVRVYEDARNLLARVEVEHPVLEKELEEGTEGGAFSDPFARYRWERTVALADPNSEVRLFEVSTRIYWSERGRDRYEEVVTFVYDPEREGSF